MRMIPAPSSLVLCGAWLIALLSGCSASAGKVVVGSNAPLNMSYIALLPVQAPIGVRAERVERTRDLVASELKNKGLLIVEDRIIDSICSQPECPERKELFRKYHVDGVASLKLDSVRNGDFYLGRYSTVSGSIEFQNRSGDPVLRTEHTTRQAGGLLLNTGAVFQAVKTLSDSFQDSTFEPLAARFAKELVSDISFSNNDAVRASNEDLEIRTLTVDDIGRGRKKLCVRATPSNLLTLSSRSIVSDLAEISPGNYCAVYPGRSVAMIEKYSAQLRTPSGISVTKQLGVPVPATARFSMSSESEKP